MNITGFSTVKALISDHLWNSEKWSQLGLAAHEKELLFKEGDMGICGVAVPLIFLCGVAVNKIPSRGVAVISNRTVCGVFDFKPAMFGEKKFLADPLRCCGSLFDTFDRLTLVE